MKDKENYSPIKKTARSSPRKRARKPSSSNKIKKRGARSKSIKTLKNKLWKLFSWFIRLRDSDKQGYGKCVTCEDLFFWKQLQGGHFVQQHGHPNTLFNERNVHAQCSKCNLYLQGNQYLHGKKINQMYGEGTAEDLVALSKLDKKFNIEELEQLIEYYTKQVNKLLKEKDL